MHTHRFVAFRLTSLTAAVLGLGLAGCTDDEPGTETVTVVMNEFSLSLDRPSAPAGTVRFAAQNRGHDVHELVLLKTDLAPDALPIDAAGDVDEAGAGVQLVAEVEDVAAGADGEFTADVQAGKYVLVCNISMPEGDTVEHHYALGMRAQFTVE